MSTLGSRFSGLMQTCLETRTACDAATQTAVDENVRWLLTQCGGACDAVIEEIKANGDLASVLETCKDICEQTAEACQNVDGADVYRCREICLRCSKECQDALLEPLASGFANEMGPEPHGLRPI